MFPGQILAGTKAVALASQLAQHLTPSSPKNSASFQSLLEKQTLSADPSSAKTVPADHAGGQKTDAEAKLLTQLASQLKHLLAEQGISLDKPLVLEIDSFGDLRLSDSHDRALDIETTLFMNPQIAELAQALIDNRLQKPEFSEHAASQARLIVQGNQARIAFIKSDENTSPI